LSAHRDTMKKFGKWLVVNILWPILKELFVEFGKQLIKLAGEGFKVLLAKWLAQDIEAASSETEAQALRIRYSGRIRDIDEMTTHMTEKVEDVVRTALQESEATRDAVLESGTPPMQLPEVGDA
jgi:hypothetical protein